jgi:hypothetical protein
VDPLDLGPGFASSLSNVHIQDGAIRPRRGYTAINSEVPRGFVFSDLFDRDNERTSVSYVREIANVTQADPCQITTSNSHGLVTGDVVRIGLIASMVELNNQAYSVTFVDTTNFTIDVDSQGYTAHAGSADGIVIAHSDRHARESIFWGALHTGYTGTVDHNLRAVEIWNQTMRGGNDLRTTQTLPEHKAVMGGVVILDPNTEGGSAVSFQANYAVEFLLRKFAGFPDYPGQDDVALGNNSALHPTNEAATSCDFCVDLRAGSLIGFNQSTNDTDDDAYEIAFTVPVGNGTNELRWNDLVVNIYKRSGGTRGAAVFTYAGDEEGPGTDEWIRVRLEVYGTSTTTIKIYVDDTELVDDGSGVRYADSSSPFLSGFTRLLWRPAAATDNYEELVRQVQIGCFRGMSLDVSGDEDGTESSMHMLAKGVSASGTSYLLAGAGNQLLKRSGSTFEILDHTSTVLNRRCGIESGASTLSYVDGNDFFTITDAADSNYLDLSDYSFSDGHRVELIWAHETQATVANVVFGIYDIERKDGERIIRCKGKPSVSGDLTAVPIAYRILPASSAEGIPGITHELITSRNAAGSAAFGHHTYIADAVSHKHRMLKTNGQSAYLVGMKAPIRAPDVANSNQGITLSGDFSYKYTFYNRVLGIESSASPESAETSLTTGATITIRDASADLNATHVRLYRHKSGGATGWFLTATIPIQIDDLGSKYSETGAISFDRTFWVHDTIPDGDESDTIEAPELENSIPPTSVCCATHLDRMWYVPQRTSDGSKLYYSESGNPDAVDPTSFLRVGEAYGGRIRAIIPGQAMLLDSVIKTMLILKDNSAWLMTGDSPSSVQIDLVATVGCSSYRAWGIDEFGRVYWAGADGVYRWSSAGGIEDLSYMNLPTYRGFKTSHYQYMAMGIDYADGLVLVNAASQTAGTPNRLFVIHYRNPAVEHESGHHIYDWSVWDIAARCFVSDHESAGAANLPARRKLMFVDHGSGLVAIYRGDDGTAMQDDGEDYSWFWNGPDLNLGTRRLKRWKYLSAEFEQDGTGGAMTVGYVEPDGTARDTATNSTSVASKIVPVQRRLKHIAPRFAGSAGHNTRILSYEVDAEVLGRR